MTSRTMSIISWVQTKYHLTVTNDLFETLFAAPVFTDHTTYRSLLLPLIPWRRTYAFIIDNYSPAIAFSAEILFCKHLTLKVYHTLSKVRSYVVLTHKEYTFCVNLRVILMTSPVLVLFN